MSLLNSIKKAFGFPDSYDDENDVDSDDIDTVDSIGSDNSRGLDLTPPRRQTDTEAPGQPPAENAPTQETSAASTPDSDAVPALAAKAFDSVVKLFNSIQPEFVSRCLDTEAQRSYILQNIDSELRQALEQATAEARARGERQWQAERARMSSDLDKIRKEHTALKLQREEFQNAQLSASRQKRALSDRIHDLENQVAALEAEKEQFQIENRSMANKLRASGVIRDMAAESPEASDLAKKLEETSLELENKTRQSLELQKRIEELETLLSKSETELATSRKELAEIEEEMQKSVAIIDSRIADFERIKKKKDTRISQLNAAAKHSDARIKELENELAICRKQLEENASHKPADSIYQPATVEPDAVTDSQPDGYTSYSDFNLSPTGNTPEHTSTPTGKISAIDDLMDNTDWFVAPEPVPLKKDPEVEEQFGYKEPRQRASHQNDDDKQLSLF